VSLDRVREAAARDIGDTSVPGVVALVAKGDGMDVVALGRLGVGRAPVQRNSVSGSPR
jgi:hypothetical protein